MNVQSIRKKFFIRKTFFSFLLAFIIFYFLLSKINFENVVKIILNANIYFLIFAFLLYYVSFLFKSLRWRVIIGNVGLKTRLTSVYEIYFLGQFVNSILPGRLGDFYRAQLMKMNYGIARSKIIATIFSEKIIDLLFTFGLLLISVVLLFGTDIPKWIVQLLVFGVILVIALFLSLMFMNKLRKVFFSRIPKNTRVISENFERSYLKSINFKTFPIILIYTLLLWFFEFLIFFLVTKSISLNLSISLVIFTVLMANILLILPITPSGLGVVEAGVVGVLIYVGLNKDISVTAALLYNIVNYWNQLLFGFLAYVFSKKIIY